MSGMRGSSTIAADRAARRELRAALTDLHDAQLAAGIRAPMGRRWWVVIAVVVLASLALATWAVCSWREADAGFADADYEQAAADRVALLLAPNHRDPQQVKRILAGATGIFYDEFGQSADAYSTFVQANGTVAQSSVDGTGLSGRVGDDATVLVAATVVFDAASSGSEDGQVVRRFRLRVLVTPEDGVLKLGAVQYLP